MVVLFWIILSFVVAMMGESRTIGFWGSLFLSLFLSPLIGFIAVMLSERQSDIEHKQKIESMLNAQLRQQSGTLTNEDKARLYDERMKAAATAKSMKELNDNLNEAKKLRSDDRI